MNTSCQRSQKVSKLVILYSSVSIQRHFLSYMHSEPLKNVTILFFLSPWLILADFYNFLYHFNREEILHATIIKFITLPNLCVPCGVN